MCVSGTVPTTLGARYVNSALNRAQQSHGSSEQGNRLPPTSRGLRPPAKLRQSKQSARWPAGATPSLAHPPAPIISVLLPEIFCKTSFHIFTNFKEPRWSGGRFL